MRGILIRGDCFGVVVFSGRFFRLDIQYLTQPLAPPEEGRLPAGLSHCGCFESFYTAPDCPLASPFVCLIRGLGV